MLNRTRGEVTRAAQKLELPEAQFRILSEQEAAPILAQIEAAFVKERGLRWWWEAFRSDVRTHVHFSDGRGWMHLKKIVPPESGLVWFIVENNPDFVLCESTMEALLAVIGDCWGVEYYIVSRHLDWLVGENHHDVLFAVGEGVGERLTMQRFVQEGLHMAIRNRNPEAVKALLDQGAEIDTPDKRGWSPLSRAIEREQSEMALLLLERGANVHSRDRRGRQALHWAAQYGLDEVVAELLKRGADAAAADAHNKTPLNQAIRFGRTATANMLLEQRPWPEHSPWLWRQDFFQAVHDRRPAIVALFLEAGRDVDCTFHRWRDGDFYEATALMEAAAIGDLRLVKLLLRYGADVRKRSRRRSALTEALERHGEHAPVTQMLLALSAPVGLEEAVVTGNFVLAEQFLAVGAPVEMPDAEGQTLLVWAARHRQPEMVRLLIRFGADPSAQDNFRRNVLSAAAEAGDIALADFLIRHGAARQSDLSWLGMTLAHAAGAGRIDATRWFLERYGLGADGGAAALCAAISRSHREIVRLLLDAGVAIDARSSMFHERLPVSWAALIGDVLMVRLLLERGADVNATPRDSSALVVAAGAGRHRVIPLLLEQDPAPREKDKALLAAVSTGRDKTAEILLKAGADPNSVGHYGRTALIWAARMCKPMIVSALLERGARADDVDNQGKTALVWAEEARRTDNAALLVQAR